MDSRQTSVAILVGLLTGILALVANYFLDVPKVNPQFSQVLFPVIMVIMIILYAVMMILRFRIYSLQIKLITVFFAIALIPLGIVAILYNNFLTDFITQKVSNDLRIAGTKTASDVDDFISSNLNDIVVQAKDTTYVNYLGLGGRQNADPYFQNQVSLNLNRLREKAPFNINSYAILNIHGINQTDTNPDSINADESKEEYFRNPMSNGRPYMSSVWFSPKTKQPFIYFSASIESQFGTRIGVLRVRFDAAILQQILNRYFGFLGPHSYPVLLDENKIRLADSLTPDNIYKSIAPLEPSLIQQLQASKRLPIKPGNQLSTNIPDFSAAIDRRFEQPFFSTRILPGQDRVESGVIVPLQSRSWMVVYMQDQSIYLAPINAQTRLLVLLAAIVAGIVTVIALGLANFLSRPIQDLTAVSIRVSSGDLRSRAVVRSSDEIGVLGQAFNNMTGQLQSLIGNLEKRVDERTHDLAVESERNRYRATQLLTVADVARAITTVQDLEALLTSVTRLINERFGFYHVGIFLLDEKKEYAVLQASNSDGGQRMLARAHRLKVGQVGIVGYVTGKGEPRIATDVGVDAVFFNNPDLPETRSEMALPLQTSGQIIGALDVQSTESNAFSAEDVELFKTLADQVAIAIENNRLFAETREALLEMQKLHRQYLQQEWSRETAERKVKAVRYARGGVFIQKPIEIPEVQQVFHSGQVIAHGVDPSQTTESKSALAVPIKLRDEVIGVIDFQDANQNRNWSEEEITLVKKVADQIGVALENVRLFEQTVRRAERERKVLEITGKIRATNDPQVMLQTAVQELQKALNASRAQVIMKQPAGVVEESRAAMDRGSNGDHPGEN
ncbi:MAG TPA: GAF domain-containing protein [Anaerolineaceae bacterium]|nr:GAF domain-containing protein [Anaerolineaceae bacterium]